MPKRKVSSVPAALLARPLSLSLPLRLCASVFCPSRTRGKIAVRDFSAPSRQVRKETPKFEGSPRFYAQPWTKTARAPGFQLIAMLISELVRVELGTSLSMSAYWWMSDRLDARMDASILMETCQIPISSLFQFYFKTFLLRIIQVVKNLRWKKSHFDQKCLNPDEKEGLSRGRDTVQTAPAPSPNAWTDAGFSVT